MHKALEVELTDWQRDQEPDIDHEGCYHTSLPTIITQVLQQWLDRQKLCWPSKLRIQIMHQNGILHKTFTNNAAFPKCSREQNHHLLGNWIGVAATVALFPTS